MHRGGFHLSKCEKDGEQKEGGEEKNRQKLEER